MVPVVICMAPGSIFLPNLVGRSVGDPDGRSRGAAVGGFIGLAAGAAGHFLTRRRNAVNEIGSCSDDDTY